MRANEFIVERRDAMFRFVKSVLPKWPDYVLKDWIYNLARGNHQAGPGSWEEDPEWGFNRRTILKMIADNGLSPDTQWQLVPDMQFTLDMFAPKSKQKLIGRAGGSSDLGMGIPRDKERHATQAALAQQQGGIRKEPVILLKTANGYELLEGWHRTIQHFHKYPDGYTGPAYVAVAQGQQGVAEGSEKHLMRESASEREIAQIQYMQGECAVLALTIRNMNPQRFTLGFVYEFFDSSPDMYLEPDEFDELDPARQQEIQYNHENWTLTHAYVFDVKTREYIDAEGRHKQLPTIGRGFNATRHNKFPAELQDLVNVSHYMEWDEAQEKWIVLSGWDALDKAYTPEGKQRAREYAIKYLGIDQPAQGVAEGEINDTAISLSKLGKFHPGADALAEFVPERASVQYALHPDKWESTFYSLTNKDSDKLRYYGPKKISIPPGTLVGDMAIANKFYRAKTPEEKQQYAKAYKASLQSYPVDVNQYRMPELLMPRQNVDEAFDTPLPITWEKGMHGDVDALAKLPDGSNLSIMFNKQDNIKPDDKTWMVEFYRNNSQEVTGEGDAQKVFSTVLVAIQQFIKKYKPLKIYFSASKEMDPGINYGPDDVVPNPESRAKLYDRMVLRYAKSWGYKFFRADNGSSVIYQLSRMKSNVAEAEAATKNSNEIWRQLRAAGYHHVGSGADATVWAKDDSHVIKILMPEDAGSKAEQVFRKFYEFSMSHQDLPCVPRFNEVNTVDINGKDYTQIEMERLSPIEKGGFLQGVVWLLSDYAIENKPWSTVERELTDGHPWYFFNPNYSGTFARTWQSILENPASKKTYNMYKQLYAVMQLLYTTGNINKFGWDLHTANVMQRANGQPVIIDPWFSEGTS